MFLGSFCFHVSQVFFFKGICARIVFPIHCWDSELSNLLSWKFVLLTCALCQLSNLVNANNKFSTSLFVPFQFKWRPLFLQSYFGLMFELLIKQIFLLRHSFFRCLFTYFVLSLSLQRIIPETNALLLSRQLQ